MPLVPKTDDTFCIAVLGDFLGEGSGSPAAGRVSWEPLRATPDTVFGLGGLRPRIRVSTARGGTEEIEFSSLESFEPGSLFRRLPLFSQLREDRERARKPIPPSGASGGKGSPAGSSMEDPPPELEAGSGKDLLGTILDQTEASQEAEAFRDPGRPGTDDELGAFVREVVRPHRVQVDADVHTRVAAVDEEASAEMSALLHSRSFQELEGLWRSLVTLLSRVDTSGRVRVYLVHLPKSDLERDLMEADDPTGSRLFDLLAAPDLGAPGRKWALTVGAYGFQRLPEDIRFLEKIAKVARAANVPWLSSIRLAPGQSQREGGADSEEEAEAFPEDWARLRERPEAGWLGLTHPRFLVREPYDGSSRPSKVFDFKEISKEKEHLLWGEGAFLCAALLAQGYAEGGWGFRPETRLAMEGMPLASIGEEAGELSTSMERSLTLPQAEALARHGLIPLLGSPDRAGIRIGGVRSVAAGEAFVRAWWRES